MMIYAFPYRGHEMIPTLLLRPPFCPPFQVTIPLLVLFFSAANCVPTQPPASRIPLLFRSSVWWSTQWLPPLLNLQTPSKYTWDSSDVFHSCPEVVSLFVFCRSSSNLPVPPEFFSPFSIILVFPFMLFLFFFLKTKFFLSIKVPLLNFSLFFVVPEDLTNSSIIGFLLFPPAPLSCFSCYCLPPQDSPPGTTRTKHPFFDRNLGLLVLCTPLSFFLTLPFFASPVTDHTFLVLQQLCF